MDDAAALMIASQRTRMAATGIFPEFCGDFVPGKRTMSSASDGLITLVDTQLAMARSDDLAALFEHPSGSVHRRFEICRAYFLEGRSAPAIAERFELHPGTVQAVVRDFAADPDLSGFFTVTRTGPKTSPKRRAVRERVVTLRREHRKSRDMWERIPGRFAAYLKRCARGLRHRIGDAIWVYRTFGVGFSFPSQYALPLQTECPSSQAISASIEPGKSGRHEAWLGVGYEAHDLRLR